MTRVDLATPWARSAAPYSSPRSLIVKLALGEAPEQIPAGADVRRGLAQPPARTGLGPVDRVLGHFLDTPRVTRVHSAAAAAAAPGRRHRGFDDLEQAIGLSRTFRVDSLPGAPIADTIDALRQVAVVEEAGPQYVCVQPFAGTVGEVADPLELAWASRDLVSAAEATGYEVGDPAVIIAVIDTGVLEEHPELRARLRPGLDTVRLSSSDVAPGIQLLGDTTQADTDTEDEVGHGTSCASIIGAAGQRIPPGLAGACGILPMRVLGAARFPGKAERVGIGAISDIDAGMKRAVDVGAKVLNLSFGTPLDALDEADPVPHRDLVRYALARGCVLVAASGNTGREQAFTPAALDGVVAVSAVDDTGQPCRFATSGAHVCLAAPGQRVVSATLGGYGMVTGTSFAAPFVAAAAGLLVSRAARRAFPLDGVTARRILAGSAAPWPPGGGKGHGAGVLDAYGALRMLDREMNRAPPEWQPNGALATSGAGDAER